MTKITDLIKCGAKFSYSFEVTPDVCEEDIDALDVEPTFFSVTWHAKYHKCKDLDIEPLQVANLLISKQKQVLLHLSCDMLREDYLKKLLITLRDRNICNLFLILGENYDPKSSDFNNTSKLIEFIRKETGNYFCIGVAGFPDCSEESLLRMKTKIEVGADFIITQAFFDTNMFKEYTEKCNKININVPIIPGIFPFETFNQLTGFINLCKIKVTENFLDSVKKEGEAGKSSLEVIKSLIHELQTEYHVTHFHIFTLNKLKRINTFLLEMLH